jgi:hypothetical protein
VAEFDSAVRVVPFPLHKARKPLAEPSQHGSAIIRTLVACDKVFVERVDEWFKAVEIEAMRSTCPPKWHWLNNPWKVSHPADRRKHRAKY